MNPNPMGLGLNLLRRVSGSAWLEHSGLRQPFERLVFHASRGGFAAVAAANRRFTAAKRLDVPGRPPASAAGLFDLTPKDDQAMLAEAAARFAGERLRPAAAAADVACAAPPALLGEAAELGFAALSVPEALDGAAGEHSAVTGALVHAALAKGDLSLALACLAPVGAANALLRWGSAEQQAAYLAPFAGDSPPPAALALGEPQTAFDPFALATVAAKRGGQIQLDGAKSLVPRAADAEFFIVAARAEDGAPQLYIVERGAAGLHIEAEPAMGLRAAATGRLYLRGVAVDAQARLGGDAGCDYAACVALSRLAWAALAVGCAEAVLDYVRDYANERQAFGEPVSHRQAVAFAVADIAIELESLRLALWRAAARDAAGLGIAREAALARRLTAKHAMDIGSQGVQLLGGHGFVKDHPVERWYRDLRAAGILEGAVCL